MKRTIISVFVLTVLGAGFLFLSPQEKTASPQVFKEKEAKHGIAGAKEWFSRMRANVKTGKFEIEDYYKALTQTLQMQSRSFRSSQPMNPINWIELGPNTSHDRCS